MTRVQRSPDCKNSPKNTAAEDVAIELLSGNVEALAQHLTEDAAFDIVGERTVQGRDEVLGLVASGLEPGLASLRIDHALTHGKVGAVNGSLTTGSGSEKGFCLMLEFATTKAAQVRQLKLYLP